jgi:hypothetical protein
MQVARQFAGTTVEVTQYTAQYPEDGVMVPPWCIRTPDLERSVLDIGSFGVPRKLPLIADILNRAYAASDAEYFTVSAVFVASAAQRGVTPPSYLG